MDQDTGQKIRDQYEGPFLKAEHIPALMRVPCIIRDVTAPNTMKDARKRMIDKPILWFVGKTKGLIINTTMYRTLENGLGPVEGWIGREVEIERRYLKRRHSFNKLHNEPCLRVFPVIGRDASGERVPVPIRFGIHKFNGSREPFAEGDT